MDPIRNSDFVLECDSCKHVFIERVELPMAVSAFCRRLKAWNCTKCGATKGILVLTDQRRLDAIEKLNQPDTVKGGA